MQILFQQDNIQKILLSLTSRIAETHLAHEKRRILSMYRLFVLLLLKELPDGLGNTWAFFIRDVIYSLLRIITDGKKVNSHPREQLQQSRFGNDDDLFRPCCNLLFYVCKKAVECCSQVRSYRPFLGRSNHIYLDENSTTRSGFQLTGIRSSTPPPPLPSFLPSLEASWERRWFYEILQPQ